MHFWHLWHPSYWRRKKTNKLSTGVRQIAVSLSGKKKLAAKPIISRRYTSRTLSSFLFGFHYIFNVWNVFETLNSVGCVDFLGRNGRCFSYFPHQLWNNPNVSVRRSKMQGSLSSFARCNLCRSLTFDHCKTKLEIMIRQIRNNKHPRSHPLSWPCHF